MTMDYYNNLDMIMEEINKFEGSGANGEISTVLEDYLRFVSKTGDPLLPWNCVKGFIRHKLSSVMGEFYDLYGGDDVIETANIPSFSYAPTRNKILQHFDSFVGAPFTIQRLCEILIDPKRHYKRTDKFLRGLEKNILVVSFIEPGHTKRMKEQQNVANGLQDMSPPHIPIGSINDAPKESSSNSTLSENEDVNMADANEDDVNGSPISSNVSASYMTENDDVEMAQSCEEQINGTPTTNGVGEDSSSSSSSSSSSTSSSPPPDEEPHELAPLPKRPRLEVNEKEASKTVPQSHPETKEIEGVVISVGKEEKPENSSDASICDEEKELDMMDKVTEKEEKGENESVSIKEVSEEPSECLMEDVGSNSIPKKSENLNATEDEEENPPNVRDLSDLVESKVEEVATSQDNAEVNSNHDFEEDSSSAHLSPGSEVGSSNHIQEEAWTQENSVMHQRSTSNGGSPDSAQDSQHSSECDEMNVEHVLKENSEAAAASMRRLSSDASSESEELCSSSPEKKGETDGSEADSTSFQSSPLSSSASSSENSAVRKSCTLSSSTIDEEEKLPLHSSTSETDAEETDSASSTPKIPADSASPQTQIISTSRRESDEHDESLVDGSDEAKNVKSEDQDEDTSCSSSNP